MKYLLILFLSVIGLTVNAQRLFLAKTTAGDSIAISANNVSVIQVSGDTLRVWGESNTSYKITIPADTVLIRCPHQFIKATVAGRKGIYADGATVLINRSQIINLVKVSGTRVSVKMRNKYYDLVVSSPTFGTLTGWIVIDVVDGF